MQLSASLQSKLTARDLLAFEPGDVVSLGVPSHKQIDLHVGSTLKFKGRLALDAGRVGVAIEQRVGGADTAGA
jgi:flagellar motor switch protein FliM